MALLNLDDSATPPGNVVPSQHRVTYKSCFNIDPGGEGEISKIGIKVFQDFCPGLSEAVISDHFSSALYMHVFS